MARNTMEAWLPEEDDSEVIQRVNQTSAAESLFRRVPMGSNVKNHPRSAGVGVSAIEKGGAYGEDESANDAVTLTARKLGRAIRIAEEDLDDTLANVIAAKQLDWATSYGKFVDNAVLAVTAAENGTTVPFTSVYRALQTTVADLDYTAGDNYVQTGTGGTGDPVPPSYDDLSGALGLLEGGDYFDVSNIAVIAHPSFRGFLRGVKDTQNMPVFVQGLAGTPDTIFGHPVSWSLGAKTHATATDAPTGNPLAIFVNRDYALLGVRSGPESIFIDGRSGVSALTDEALLKMRARRAFAVGHPKAFSILEVTNAAS